NSLPDNASIWAYEAAALTAELRRLTLSCSYDKRPRRVLARALVLDTSTTFHVTWKRCRPPRPGQRRAAERGSPEGHHFGACGFRDGHPAAASRPWPYNRVESAPWLAVNSIV